MKRPAYVPDAERNAWANFEAALDRYLDAEMQVLKAALKMREAVHGKEVRRG